MGDDPVGHLAGHLGHAGAYGGQEDPRRSVGVGPGRTTGSSRCGGRTCRRHRGSRRRSTTPRWPEGPVRTHACGRRGATRGPRSAARCGVEPGSPGRAPTGPGRTLQLICGVRQGHGVAGEGDGDCRTEGHRLGVLGRQGQGQEGVVGGLRRPEAVQPGPLGGGHAVGAEAGRVRGQNRSSRTLLVPPASPCAHRWHGCGRGAGPRLRRVHGQMERHPDLDVGTSPGWRTDEQVRATTWTSSGTAPGWALTATGTPDRPRSALRDPTASPRPRQWGRSAQRRPSAVPSASF